MDIGYHINETKIGDKFIASNIHGGSSCYSKKNIDLIINSQIEKNESPPHYTALMYYWDKIGYIKQFDNLQTVYEYNEVILITKSLHKADYIGHELIM